LRECKREYAIPSDTENAARDAPQHPAALLRRCISVSSKRKSSAPAHPSPVKKQLAKLEWRYRHELMDVEERLELRERILRLCRRLGL